MKLSRHILTVDVEDWPQSTLDHSLPIGDRVVANTLALLEIFEEANVRGTFFVLGKVAEKHPTLAVKIARAGHEVATHGYSHESLETMTGRRFKEELHRSIELLREQTGEPVYGHRAADFSISARRLYFLEYLLEEGLTYDSSIFPIRHARYGVSGAHRYPHLIRCASRRTLVEFPPATMKLGGVALTGVGGGYFRVLPYWWTKCTLRSFERAQYAATCYFHPYEIDALELRDLPYPVPPVLRFSEFLNRGSVTTKLRRLLSSYRFTTMIEACRNLNADRLQVALDLGILPHSYGNVANQPGHSPSLTL